MVHAGRVVSSTMACQVVEEGGEFTVTLRDAAAEGPAVPTSIQELLGHLPLNPVAAAAAAAAVAAVQVSAPDLINCICFQF